LLAISIYSFSVSFIALPLNILVKNNMVLKKSVSLHHQHIDIQKTIFDALDNEKFWQLI
jgi:hypothetical protein